MARMSCCATLTGLFPNLQAKLDIPSQRVLRTSNFCKILKTQISERDGNTPQYNSGCMVMYVGSFNFAGKHRLSTGKWQFTQKKQNKMS